MLKVSNRDNEGRNLEKDFFREGCRISFVLTFDFCMKINLFGVQFKE